MKHSNWQWAEESWQNSKLYVHLDCQPQWSQENFPSYSPRTIIKLNKLPASKHDKIQTMEDNSIVKFHTACSNHGWSSGLIHMESLNISTAYKTTSRWCWSHYGGRNVLCRNPSHWVVCWWESVNYIWTLDSNITSYLTEPLKMYKTFSYKLSTLRNEIHSTSCGTNYPFDQPYRSFSMLGITLQGVHDIGCVSKG